MLWPLWVTDSRGFGATMCVCIASIARESDFIQATCVQQPEVSNFVELYITIFLSLFYIDFTGIIVYIVIFSIRNGLT